MSIRLKRLAALLACSLLLTACGGDGGDGEDAPASSDGRPPSAPASDVAAPATATAPGATTTPSTTTPDTSAPDTSAPDTSAPDASAPDASAPDTSAPSTTEPGTTTEIDRTGHFTSSQSEFLNPLLAKQQQVATKSEAAAEVERCNKVNAAGSEADDPKRAASCWLKMGTDSVKAIAAVERGLDDVQEGPWNADCIDGIEAAQKALAGIRAKWVLMRDGWARYAKGDYSDAEKLNGYVDAAWAAQRTIPKQMEKLSTVCYVEADLQAARSQDE